MYILWPEKNCHLHHRKHFQFCISSKRFRNYTKSWNQHFLNSFLITCLFLLRLLIENHVIQVKNLKSWSNCAKLSVYFFFRFRLNYYLLLIWLGNCFLYILISYILIYLSAKQNQTVLIYVGTCQHLALNLICGYIIYLLLHTSIKKMSFKLV